jgi:hypothetical protein
MRCLYLAILRWLDRVPVARRRHRVCRTCGYRVWAGERRCRTCQFAQIGLYDPDTPFFTTPPSTRWQLIRRELLSILPGGKV